LLTDTATRSSDKEATERSSDEYARTDVDTEATYHDLADTEPVVRTLALMAHFLAVAVYANDKI
jgi:hypothetical protein